MEYFIWRVCERFGICPPGVKNRWDDCDVETQCALLAYEEGRENEDLKEKAAMAGVKL